MSVEQPLRGERPLRVVIAAGGTGGHLYPGVALAQALLKVDPASEILFVGTEVGMALDVIPKMGFQLVCIAGKGFVGKGVVARVISMGSCVIGFFQAMSVLISFSPKLVIGMGGYIAFPVVLAAAILRIKRVIVEPNVIPGLANRLLAPFCHVVVTAFEASNRYFSAAKTKCLGVPVRPEILLAASSARPNRTPLAAKTLLIVGGSQGANAINRAMMAALPRLKSDAISVIHQTGRRDFALVKRAYVNQGVLAQVTPFIEEVANAYAVADLVVCRAGAGTLSELAVMGLPSILIPFPFAMGHQRKNAEAFVSGGASERIEDDQLTGEVLADRILALLSDPARLAAMAGAAKDQGHPKAAEEIASACYELVAVS